MYVVPNMKTHFIIKPYSLGEFIHVLDRLNFCVLHSFTSLIFWYVISGSKISYFIIVHASYINTNMNMNLEMGLE